VNFGTIVDSITKQCITQIYECKDRQAKGLAKDFIRYVGLKEVLQRQFMVYHNLNTAYIKDKQSAQMFVSESLKPLGKYSFADIQSFNALLETKYSVPKMKSTDINRHIGNLIKYHTSEINDPQMYVESFSFVVDHISTFRETKTLDKDVLNESMELKFLKPQHVVKIAIKKFNDKYKTTFNESDRRLFNLLKSKDDGEIRKYRETLLMQLTEHCAMIVPAADEDIKKNLEKAIDRIKSNEDTDSILYGYELLSEMKEMNKHLVEDHYNGGEVIG